MRRRFDLFDQFIIKWFRNNTHVISGTVEDLGQGDPVYPPQQGNDWASRYHDTAFRDQPYNPSLLGKYWCQVINTTADPDQPLMRSNVFTLLAPGDYSEPMCTAMSTIQQAYNETCADLPDKQLVQTTPINSVSVVPTTMST